MSIFSFTLYSLIQGYLVRILHPPNLTVRTIGPGPYQSNCDNSSWWITLLVVFICCVTLKPEQNNYMRWREGHKTSKVNRKGPLYASCVVCVAPTLTLICLRLFCSYAARSSCISRRTTRSRATAIFALDAENVHKDPLTSPPSTFQNKRR